MVSRPATERGLQNQVLMPNTKLVPRVCSPSARAKRAVSPSPPPRWPCYRSASSRTRCASIACSCEQRPGLLGERCVAAHDRHYEKIGLIPSPPRRDSGCRPLQEGGRAQCDARSIARPCDGPPRQRATRMSDTHAPGFLSLSGEAGRSPAGPASRQASRFTCAGLVLPASRAGAVGRQRSCVAVAAAPSSMSCIRVWTCRTLGTSRSNRRTCTSLCTGTSRVRFQWHSTVRCFNSWTGTSRLRTTPASMPTPPTTPTIAAWASGPTRQTWRSEMRASPGPSTRS